VSIAYSAVSSKGVGAGAISFAHTIAAAKQQRMLIAFLGTHGSAAANLSPTGIQYNGVAMTNLNVALAWNKTSNFYQLDAWYMLEANLPAAGAYNITGNTGSNAYSDQIIAISLTGCKQQAPTYVTNTSVVAASTISTSGLTFRSTDWLVDSGFFWPPSASTYTPGTGQVFRKEQASDRYNEVSTLPYGAAGTSWTEDQNWNSAGLLTLDLEQYPEYGSALMMALARQ